MGVFVFREGRVPMDSWAWLFGVQGDQGYVQNVFLVPIKAALTIVKTPIFVEGDWLSKGDVFYLRVSSNIRGPSWL